LEDELSEDDSAGSPDGVVTRTEQQLLVDIERYEASRVRLRKYIVTEEVSLTIALSHEELQIEREVIDESEAGSPSRDRDLIEDESEIVLYGERLVVLKKTIPVERVRAVKEIVTRDETITEGLRQEQCIYKREDIT
jgi:uncharacterized protein (TIGR02271 family)